jgi:hypothetical protein
VSGQTHGLSESLLTFLLQRNIPFDVGKLRFEQRLLQATKKLSPYAGLAYLAYLFRRAFRATAKPPGISSGSKTRFGGKSFYSRYNGPGQLLPPPRHWHSTTSLASTVRGTAL